MLLALCLPTTTESLHRGWEEEKLPLLSVLKSEGCSWWCLLTTFLGDWKTQWPFSCSYYSAEVLFPGFFPNNKLKPPPWLETNSAQAQGVRPSKTKKKQEGTGHKQILTKKNPNYVIFLLTGERERPVQFQANKSDPCFTNLRSVGKCSGAVYREGGWWLLVFFALCYLNVNSCLWYKVLARP